MNGLSGDGCPKCSGIRRDTELFILEANDIHDFRYSYNNADYKNSEDHLMIACPVHGDFSQQAIAHLRGQGCPKCGEI